MQLNYNAEDVIERFGAIRKLKVLVVGDTIIDQYHYCSSIGKSPKDNIMIVKYLSEECFAGGVLAAANHIAGFCDSVHLVTCLGKQNSREGFIRTHLKQNITPKFFYRADTATVVKSRFVEPHSLTKIFGVSYLDDYSLPDNTLHEVCEYLETHLKEYDIVIVTDFGHGFIDEEIVDALTGAQFLAVNTQTNTDNAGFNFITKYHYVDYICLDEPETRLAYQAKYDKIEELVLAIAVDLHCDNIIITHGQYDTLIYSKDTGFLRVPVFSKEVQDTTGAGDALFAITSLCVKAGFPMGVVGFVGNAVGALKVRTVCNRSSVEPHDLFKFIKELLQDINTGGLR